MLIKGSVPLKRVADFARGCDALWSTAGRRVAAHAGNGIVYASVAAATGDETALVAAVARVSAARRPDCGGFAMVLRAPREVSEQSADLAAQDRLRPDEGRSRSRWTRPTSGTSRGPREGADRWQPC